MIAATITTDERRCYCRKCKKERAHLHREYAAVPSGSLARGDFFSGEDGESEVGSITGSAKGATLYRSEGDADVPTLLSVDRNQYFCSPVAFVLISSL